MHFYNDNDAKTAAWLSELVARSHLPPGTINTTSINDLATHDLSTYTQCHFFAGIGGWPLALRLAGWPDDQPVWTGSCPCQPFSVAGRGKGVADARHLWPAFLKLIALHHPPVIFGEQVAGKAGRLWLAGIRADLEALGYAVGAADLCAAGVGAPHIRQRIYWVAYAQHTIRRPLVLDRQAVSHRHDARWSQAHSVAGACGEVCRVADAGRERDERRREVGDISGSSKSAQEQDVGESRWDNALRERQRSGDANCNSSATGDASPHPAWLHSIYLPCLDHKSRRIEPRSFPLAYGVPARVVRLRGYGNAIVPPLAAEFIIASVEAINDASMRCGG